MKMRLQQAFSTLVRAPTQRISKRNSTGNASWGGGPNTEADEKSAYNNVQVGGPQHREIGFPISTDNASWGGTTIKKYFFYRN
ncbi:hypothetical protein HMPRFS0000_2493 [Staphylococcus aureus]|nr:hypothetical protein HMPRFS0000_2493 [Staphylococcus aureus]